MWIDAHAHLYGLDESAIGGLLDACRNAGVSSIINTGASLFTSEKVIEQRSKHQRLPCAAGISPFEAAALPDSWAKRLEGLVRAPGVLAVGEIGLDASNSTYPDINLQLPLFERQLDIALSAKLPVILHSRGQESRVAEICIRHGIQQAMFHCFTGDLAALKVIMDAGYYVSFSGIITFKNSSLADCVRYAPLERTLIETDSPYLAPAPHRGETNRPDWVVIVGKKLAEIKNADVEAIAAAMTRNFHDLFGIEA